MTIRLPGGTVHEAGTWVNAGVGEWDLGDLSRYVVPEAMEMEEIWEEWRWGETRVVPWVETLGNLNTEKAGWRIRTSESPERLGGGRGKDRWAELCPRRKRESFGTLCCPCPGCQPVIFIVGWGCLFFAKMHHQSSGRECIEVIHGPRSA